MRAGHAKCVIRSIWIKNQNSWNVNCDKNFCSKCLNLTNAEYKLFHKQSDLHWYCLPCEEKTMKNIKIEKEIEDRCKEFFSKYEKRLEALESKVRKKLQCRQCKKYRGQSERGE